MDNDFVRKEGNKVLYVLNEPYQAEKIYKRNNNIIGYENGDIVWKFPNITNMDDFELEEGQKWDIPEEDEEALYQIDLDYRISKIEMGVDINDI